MMGILDPDPLKKYKDEATTQVKRAIRFTGNAREVADKYLGGPGQGIMKTLDTATSTLYKARAEIAEDPPGVRERSGPRARRRVSRAMRRRLKKQPERGLRIGSR